MNLNKVIEDTEVGWSRSVVMICSKCGKQFQDQNDQNAPERMRNELKSLIKDNQLNTQVRVITTSCLNICPENKIALTITDAGKTPIFRGIAVDPKISTDVLYNETVKN